MSKITEICHRVRHNSFELEPHDECVSNPGIGKIVAERVTSGRYASASEVIREALRLLKEHDRLNQLREEVRLGLEQLDQGQHQSFDNQVLERIKRQGRERAAAAQRKGRPR